MPLGERIEQKPKQVAILQKAAGGMYVAEANIDARLYLANIGLVKSFIEAGTAIPERFYRQSLGTDYLFQEQGWVHLHVDLMPPDDVLLLVQEQENTVVFINLTRHSIFAERPRGRSAFGLRSKIAAAVLAAGLPPRQDVIKTAAPGEDD